MVERKKQRHSGAPNAAQVNLGIGASATAARAAADAAMSPGVIAAAGPGIAKGLKAAGDLVGGGMATGPAVLSAGPGCLAAATLNSTVFRDDDSLSEMETEARASARTATAVGAAVGVAGVRIATTAGGASGPQIMHTLARIGPGGAVAGIVVLSIAPVVASTTAGFGVYVWQRRGGPTLGSVLEVR